MSEHEMSDAQFGKIFATMIASMAMLAIVLIVLALTFTSDLNARMAAQKEADKAMETTSRIAPIGSMKITAPGEAAGTAAGEGGAPTAPAGETAGAETVAAAAPSGEAVYNSSCAACHTAGVAGAPKLGDASAWTARLEQGNDVLYEHAIKGFQGSAGMMPAKGGNANLTDEEVKAAVDHMIANAK